MPGTETGVGTVIEGNVIEGIVIGPMEGTVITGNDSGVIDIGVKGGIVINGTEIGVMEREGTGPPILEPVHSRLWQQRCAPLKMTQ